MSAPFQTAAAEIEAPIEVCWDVMMDFGRYREWNPFLPSARLLDGAVPVLGQRVELAVKWPRGGSIKSVERFVRLDAPGPHSDDAVLEYAYDTLVARLRLATGRREQRLQRLGSGRTRYFTRTNPGGLLLPLLPNAQVEQGILLQTQAFKVRCESMAAGVG